MATRSLSKWKPVIDLRWRAHMAFAVHLLGSLRSQFGGRVDLQKDILLLLNDQDKITHGAAHEMIEHLAEKGYVRIERWGPGDHYKRIIVVAMPGGLALRILEPKKELPSWTRTYFAGPPNHRFHLARHRALLGTPPPPGSILV